MMSMVFIRVARSLWNWTINKKNIPKERLMSSLSESLQRRKEVAKERLAICMDCDKYNHTTTQCNECGCIMLLKTILASSSCPLKKWGVDNEENHKE